MSKIKQLTNELAAECRKEGRPLLLFTDNGLTESDRRVEFKLIGKGNDVIELVANALYESESLGSVLFHAITLCAENDGEL